uniref:Galanin peptides n=21 Tax=Neognathae TaxID=8825 RepID=A0A8B9CQ73_9AVES
PRGGGGGRWAALASPPKRVALHCGGSAAHKERRGRGDGCAEPCRAVPCRALRAVPAFWGHALRAPPDHHVHPVVARQHPVKRCEQEAVAPRLKVLPFPPLALFPPRGIWGARLFATILSLPKDARLCSHQQLGWVTRSTHPGTVSLQMQRCASFLFLSFILCAALSETFGLVLSAKEKRGWTLNSAGYLLGPHAVDNHRSFNDKHGFTGKREIQPDEDIKAGNLGRPLADENIVRTVIEFLTYLHLKEVGALDNLPSPEETNQS